MESNPWFAIGLRNFFNLRNIIFFIKGLILAILLILIVLVTLFWGGWIENIASISSANLIHAILLGLSVAFAEEIVFRGWLLEEMIYLLGKPLGIFIQSLIFSLAHIRLNMDLINSFPLFLGLFLLALVLTIRRNLDGGSLSGSIALHGGLVGGWFLISQNLLVFSLDTPSWLIGGGGFSANPIGGIGAIISMSLIVFFQRNALTRF